MFAQESMLCGRATVALLNYQDFIERWPDHPHVAKAKTALEVLVPEAEERIKKAGFPKEHGLQWYALHEASLSSWQAGKFAKCRLGDKKGAQARWKDCLAIYKHHADASENLADLQSGDGHAPWGEFDGPRTRFTIGALVSVRASVYNNVVIHQLHGPPVTLHSSPARMSCSF